MNVLTELQRMQDDALKNTKLRDDLLNTEYDRMPLTAFCKIARQNGYEIYEMDLIDAGENAFAAMKRGTNGGGENSPYAPYQEDYYTMFMAAIK